jgi:hypothetical protein
MNVVGQNCSQLLANLAPCLNILSFNAALYLEKDSQQIVLYFVQCK